MTVRRIAHIVPTDRIAYLLLKNSLMRLRAAGFDVCVICGPAPEGNYAEELRACGLDVVHVPFAREISPITDARCGAALTRAIKRGGFELVHSHNPKGGLLGPPACRLAGCRAVLHTVHGLLFNEHTRGLHRALALGAERWTAAWCDHLLFQSEEDFAYARDHRFKAPERLHLVGNGIDESHFDRNRCPKARIEKRRELGFGGSDVVVGIVGRLVAEKGYREFFEMAGRLAQTRSEVRLLVVGISEPEQSDAIDPQRMARANGLNGRCVLLDKRRDMAELYTAMDIAVLPSHREGIPRALMEASAMGLPAVASDIRGTREVIEEGVTGLLFPLRNVDAFAAQVQRLVDDANLRRKMGEAARARVIAKYTEDGTAERLVGCYEEILERTGR